jgi:hypothetical protein
MGLDLSISVIPDGALAECADPGSSISGIDEVAFSVSRFELLDPGPPVASLLRPG